MSNKTPEKMKVSIKNFKLNPNAKTYSPHSTKLNPNAKIYSPNVSPHSSAPSSPHSSAPSSPRNSSCGHSITIRDIIDSGAY